LRHATPGDIDPLAVEVDADEPKAFVDGGNASRPAAHERIEDGATGRRDEAGEVGEEVSRLHRGVSVAVAAILSAGLTRIEEPGGGTGVAITELAAIILES
jgi:hypothetical protein